MLPVEFFLPGRFFNPTEISTCSGSKSWCGYVLACSARAFRCSYLMHALLSIAACCKPCNIVALFLCCNWKSPNGRNATTIAQFWRLKPMSCGMSRLHFSLHRVLFTKLSSTGLWSKLSVGVYYQKATINNMTNCLLQPLNPSLNGAST